MNKPLFVSYSHKFGFGTCICTNVNPIQTADDFERLHKVIVESDLSISEIVIISWRRLED